MRNEGAEKKMSAEYNLNIIIQAYFVSDLKLTSSCSKIKMSKVESKVGYCAM